MFRSVYLPEERNDFIWAVAGSPWGLLAIWLVLINLVTFFAFGIDKWKAVRGKWRIRESTLLGLSLIGGAAGGLAGMYLFRHKIRKSRFRIGVPLMLIAQAVLLCVLVKVK